MLKIIMTENGPFEVSGDFKLVDEKGEHLQMGKKVYLCRCGGTSNMPFCDGTHKQKGVRS